MKKSKIFQKSLKNVFLLQMTPLAIILTKISIVNITKNTFSALSFHSDQLSDVKLNAKHVEFASMTKIINLSNQQFIVSLINALLKGFDTVKHTKDHSAN